MFHNIYYLKSEESKKCIQNRISLLHKYMAQSDYIVLVLIFYLLSCSRQFEGNIHFSPTACIIWRSCASPFAATDPTSTFHSLTSPSAVHWNVMSTQKSSNVILKCATHTDTPNSFPIGILTNIIICCLSALERFFFNLQPRLGFQSSRIRGEKQTKFCQRENNNNNNNQKTHEQNNSNDGK